MIDEFLWIDAICINQQDNLEKNIQVAMMGKTYISGEGILIWLGQEDEDARRRAGILGELGPPLEAYSDPTLGSLRDTYPRFNDKLWSEKLGMEPRSLGEWRSLSVFLQRRWFSRAWVLQEVTLARSPLTVIIRTLRYFAALSRFPGTISISAAIS